MQISYYHSRFIFPTSSVLKINLIFLSSQIHHPEKLRCSTPRDRTKTDNARTFVHNHIIINTSVGEHIKLALPSHVNRRSTVTEAAAKVLVALRHWARTRCAHQTDVAIARWALEFCHEPCRRTPPHCKVSGHGLDAYTKLALPPHVRRSSSIHEVP